MAGKRVRGLVLRRGLVIGLLGSLALAAIPLPAVAASTYEWSLSCKGSDYGFGVASWMWTVDGTALGYGETNCAGSHQGSSSGLARPDGANGLTVTVFSGFDDGAIIFGDDKTVTKSFKLDGSFNLKASVSYSENGVYGQLRYSVVFSVAG